MKKTIYTSLMAGALLLTACHHKQDDKQSEIMPVEVAQVTVDSVVVTRTFPGLLGASNKVEVVGEVNGRLLSVNFEKGTYVNKGDVLFTIDPADYQALVREAEAALVTAQSNQTYYTQQYDAMRKALESDAVSKIEVEQALSNLRQAKASVNNASSNLSTARRNLAKCTVVAPMSGWIGDSNYSPGTYINGAGQPVSLTMIYGNSQLDVSFSIAEAQYEKIAEFVRKDAHGLYSQIPLTFQERMPKKYTAQLNYESPAVDTQTGTLILKGRVLNPDGTLKHGMYVTIDLPMSVDPKAVLVKDASISTDQLGKYVYVVNDSNKVVYTPVKVGGLWQDSLRIVESGLKAGDKYVTKAMLKVRSGQEVKPVMTK